MNVKQLAHFLPKRVSFIYTVVNCRWLSLGNYNIFKINACNNSKLRSLFFILQVDANFEKAD